MVAKITFPRFTEKALQYNERKVLKGVAVCLGGDNCLAEPQLLPVDEKLAILQHRNALNDRAVTKTIHISLNFGLSEQLSQKKLTHIASFYLQKIGFGEQPYFVYQHHDAGHPHIHIVSTTIRQDGTRIATHNIGRNLSEKARKETEIYFALISSHQKKINKEKIVPSGTSKALYGKDETYRSIARVLEMVIRSYNYTSLTELNAILSEYNVAADRGKLKSNTYLKRGLYYRLLDAKGNKIGVPIKSSVLPGKPTLSFLEKRFVLNQSCRADLKQKLMYALDGVFNQNFKKNEDYLRLLEEEGITVTTQNNKREETSHSLILINKVDKYLFDSKDLDDRYNQFLENLLPKNKGDSESLPVENKSIIRVGKGSSKQSNKQRIAGSQKKFPEWKVTHHESRETNRQRQQLGKTSKGFNI